MCCDQLQKEIKNGRFKRNECLMIVFKESDYDEDYGYAVFKNDLKIEFCPFCGNKY